MVVEFVGSLQATVKVEDQLNGLNLDCGSFPSTTATNMTESSNIHDDISATIAGSLDSGMVSSVLQISAINGTLVLMTLVLIKAED